MLIAALGQRTKRMRLGPAVSVLPFHNPLIAAEEYALADNLCGGRLEFAVGSGFSPVEFQTFGMTMEQAREKFWEGFDIVVKAWTQEQFSHQGKHYRFENISLYMKPLQKPAPPIWIAASSDETLSRAGQLALPMMGIPFARSTGLADVKAKNDLYRTAYRRAGHNDTPQIMVALHVFLDQDESKAVNGSRSCFDRAIAFHKTHRRPGSKIPNFDELRTEKLAAFTTPNEATDIFRGYEQIGVTHVIWFVNFGGIPMPDVRKTLELMAQEVMPHLR